MTRKLEETLGLPHLDDIMREEGLDDRRGYSYPNQSGPNIAEGDDGHGQSMDTIYDETLRHAQSIIDLGFNMDPARAPRMFEVAAQFYKAALDAKNSKRDAQLKAMKLLLDQRRSQNAEDVPAGITDVKAVVVEDRNELIKRLREQARAEKATTDVSEDTTRGQD